MQVDPIHQFQIHNLVPMINMGGHQIAFTNSALFMFIIVVRGFGAADRRQRAARGGSRAAAIDRGTVLRIRRQHGAQLRPAQKGMKFFPFVFTLFMFVLFANLIGLIPYSFTVTSQIIMTAALALTVFFIVVGYGFWRNGLHFLNLFVPKGVPKAILPAIVIIEVLSFVSRPVSHSVRLFANMLAGHITLQVFAGFVIMLAGAGILGWFGAVLPFAWWWR